ncbi:MAG: NADH-quinone oxidoreductase subunit H [Thermoclostridium sp.]|nr:NADH-quinone oxidoreductase subunit H [Thermoclostridium sp.]
MLEGLIWFLLIIVTALFLYIIEDFIRSRMPGNNKAWLFQPVYRLIKLLGKKDPDEGCTCRWYSVASCWFAGCALYFSVMGSHLVLIYACLVMMELFVLAGAWNHGEAFAAMAAQRGIVRLLICSFTALVSVASLFHVTGSLNLKVISEYSETHGLLLQLPLTFLAVVTLLLTRGSLLFFDFNITGKGLGLVDSPLYTPYGGWSLALVQVTHWIEIGVWIKLVSVFLPFTPWIAFAASALGYLAFLLLDGFASKEQWKKVARNALIWGGGMSVMNFIWLVL